MDVYREAYDRKNQRTKMMPPGVRVYKALHWIVSMELVHAIEVDIDKLVHVLEVSINKSGRKVPTYIIKMNNAWLTYLNGFILYNVYDLIIHSRIIRLYLHYRLSVPDFRSGAECTQEASVRRGA